MDAAKLRLSEEEMRLISNADWILTKNRLMERTRLMLSALQERQLVCLHKHRGLLPAEVLLIPPKISKGENYEGLPWLMLDNPRYFTREHQWAIRSFFWWGNGFSITLQLSGRYQLLWEDVVASNHQAWVDNDWQLCISSDCWQHHFREDNYQMITTIPAEQWKERLSGLPFIKLARYWPVAQWESVPELLMEQYQLLLLVLTKKIGNF